MRRSFACAFALLAVLSLLQYIANTRFILVFAKATPPSTVLRLDFARGSILYTEFTLAGGGLKAQPWDVSIHTLVPQYRAEFGPYHFLPSFGSRWFVLPVWLIALPAAAVSAFLFMKRRPRPDHCPKCAYSLASLASRICPECGTRA